MKQETKDKLKKISNELDTVTDGVLFKLSQLDYSWAILIFSHALAFVVGGMVL